MSRKKIEIILDELPKGAEYIPAEVVNAFQKRLSIAMKEVNDEFARTQSVTADKGSYILLAQA